MSFGNPLLEAVIGRILWTKNNWQPEWRFPKNAYQNDLHHFPKKILGSRIKDLQKTYENRSTNLGKILRNYEDRALESRTRKTGLLARALWTDRIHRSYRGGTSLTSTRQNRRSFDSVQLLRRHRLVYGALATSSRTARESPTKRQPYVTEERLPNDQPDRVLDRDRWRLSRHRQRPSGHHDVAF